MTNKPPKPAPPPPAPSRAPTQDGGLIGNTEKGGRVDPIYRAPPPPPRPPGGDKK